MHPDPITDGEWLAYAWPDEFSDLIGPIMMHRLHDNPDEHVRLGLAISSKHCNRLGICHGGLLTTIADNALGLNAILTSGTDTPAPTISITVDFLGGVRLGDWVESRVRILSQTRTLIFAEGTLVTRQGPVLRCNAIFKRPRSQPTPAP